MTDQPIDLDGRRGMNAQRETEVRRLLAEVQADEVALQRRQSELEDQLAAEPADSCSSAADKARYLLMLFSVTSTAQDPRRRKLIANVLADFERLSAEDAMSVAGDAPARTTSVEPAPDVPATVPPLTTRDLGTVVSLPPGGPKKKT